MQYSKSKGFTLIEILLVVVIIGILAAMVVPNLSGQGKKAKISVARVDIESNLTAALGLYELDNGRYPTSEQGLRMLIQKPTSTAESVNWNGPYLKKKKIPNDPWQKKYVYVSPGIHNPEEYDLSSYGPDGVESGDDIFNWSDSEDEKS